MIRLTFSAKFLLLTFTFLMLTITTVSAQEDAIYTAQVVKSGNGEIIGVIYGNSDSRSEVYLYDSLSGKMIDIIDLSPAVLRKIELNSGGDRIAYVGSGILGVYDKRTNTHMTIMGLESIDIDFVRWSPTENYLAYSLGTTVIVYDVTNGTYHRTIGTGAELVVNMSWSPDGQSLVTSHFALTTDEAKVKVWDFSSPETHMVTPRLVINNYGGGNVDWSPDGSKLAILESGSFLVYDLVQDEILTEIQFPEQLPYTLKWSPDGSQIATGGSVLRKWNTNTWEIIETTQFERAVGTLQWSPDSEYIFHDGSVGGLYLNDVPVHELPFTPEATDEP